MTLTLPTQMSSSSAPSTRVGFWRQRKAEAPPQDKAADVERGVPPGSAYDDEPAELALPWPEPTHDPVAWNAQAPFRAKLAQLEAKLSPWRARCACYRGASVCRLCETRNGSKEYNTTGFVWPSGYLHYLCDHGCLAPQPFVDMVNAE